MRAPLKTALASWAPSMNIIIIIIIIIIKKVTGLLRNGASWNRRLLFITSEGT